MYLDPKELHRDMFFRSINFGKQYHVNISITVEHDNRAVIDVSIDNENGQAYACDAGCLDPPTKLRLFLRKYLKRKKQNLLLIFIVQNLYDFPLK
jgi:hypothetical protein